MKYFNPSYWFKMWVLSAPLFNSKSEGIYAKSIDNQNIKDWASKNTTNISLLENQELNLSNNQITLLDLPLWNSNLTTHNEHHKHRHQKSRNRYKRNEENKKITTSNFILFRYLPNEKRYINWFSFRSQILLILSDLENENLISRILPDKNQNQNNNISRIPIYNINSNNNQNDIFIIPIRLNDSPSYIQSVDKFTCSNNPWIVGQYENISNRDLRLIFRATDFYLQGFIANNYYYYFSDSTTRSYENTNPINLGYSSNYSNLAGNIDNISWADIYNSYNTLHNYNRIQGHDSIRQDLVRVILTTAESMRFYEISNKINEIYTHSNSNSVISWQNLTSLIQNWLNISQNMNALLSYFSSILTNSEDFLNIATLMAITEISKCNFKKGKRQKREINICDKSTEKDILVCDLKPQIDKIKGKITAIKVLDENKKGKNLKLGDVYVGTTEGLYLIHGEGVIFKVNNINDEINSISILKGNEIFVTTKKEEIFYINTDHINILYPDSVYAEGLFDSNVKSSNLEKEINLYYNNNKDNWYMNLEPNLSIQTNYENKILNLQKINPVDNYEKLEFLGDTFSDSWGVKTKWGSWIYDGNPKNHKPENTYDLKYFMKYKGDRNNKFHDIIENTKGDISKNKEQYLQSFEDWDGAAHILIDQRFGLTWYWENENYYLKVFGLQYCNWWASTASFDCHIKMGNGIRLYNDDNTFETEIPNPNDRKKRDVIDIDNLKEKNLTKWNNEFTKSINNEQHLPIDNKTNFVVSNITNL